MSRRKVRARVMEWLYDSKVGWIGWLTDAAGWLSCRIAGHEALLSAPDQCRHCGTTIDPERHS